MLNTCEVYAKDYNILFNAKKSKLMYFGRNNINTNNMMSMSNGTRQGRKSMFKHGGDNIGVNIHPVCGMYRAAQSAALC